MRAVSKLRIALVGADTLLGREIKEVLESAGVSIASFAANAEANFGEDEGEAVFRQALDAETVEGCAAIVSAGSSDGAAKALSVVKARAGQVKLIDCTGSLDQQPEARIIGSGNSVPAPDHRLLIPAHPAADVTAGLLRKLSSHQPIDRTVVEIFEPASERGQLGMAELQQQTTGLLSFKSLEKKIYDTQVSFALVPAYGENSPYHLDEIEQRIERHTASLLGSNKQGTAIPMPSLRLIQAPVFHGYTLSAWVEFTALADAGQIATLLVSDEIDVRTSEHEMPTNAGVAGQSGITVGDIRVDRNNPRAIWIWAVADNLRLMADRVRDILKHLEQPS
jgi:aspartate-semialdehyde dehydrogenase